MSAIVDSSDDAIISKNLDGIVTSWNRAAERLFGYTAEEMLGESILRLMPPDRLDEETDILRRVRQGERVDHFETVRQRKDGSVIEMSVTISPVRDAQGNVIGASTVARDVTERKRRGQADLLLAAIVSSSDDAIVSKNLQGIVTSWNDGARRIFGYTAEEMIGQPVLKLVPIDRKEEEPNILARLARGERVDHFETIRVRKNGEHFNASLTISPLRDADGHVFGASKIARDITELKLISAQREQLLESERAARSQAEHANRMKDEFLATVSHELRTPLNAIVGWTELLKSAPHDAQEVANGVLVIERNALMQAQLIDDLLDLGRISSGKMTLNVEEVDIAAVIREAVASLQHAADAKRITIKTVVTDVHGKMLGDVKRLQQVVWNVLTNAIKFTPSAGRVLVTAARTNSHLDIAVSDTGRGIAPEFLPHVFERFRQADSSTTRRHGGLGIGLALVKQLVELHAGTVRAESPGIDRGSRFTITLPIAAAHSHPASEPTAALAPVPTAADQVDLGGIKVLAVDDDRDSLEVLRRILSARHAEVKTAESVEQAVTLFPQFLPDVVLSDIGMPQHDGYELIRRIRLLPGGGSVPAAALTALARSDDRMRALQAGFQTHVAKPVAAAEIIAVVRSLASLQKNSPRPTEAGHH